MVGKASSIAWMIACPKSVRTAVAYGLISTHVLLLHAQELANRQHAI